MSHNIDNIRSALSDQGYQKTSHFACSIIMPPALSNSRMDQSIYRVNSVNFPGFNLNVDEYRHKGYGLTERRPIAVSFEDISITMIADSRGEIHNTLYDWFELIHPTDDSEIGVDEVEYFNYPNEYYGGLEIYIYDIAGGLHTTYSFVNPFPVLLGSVQMSWENVDNLMLIPVSFAYRSYKKNTSNTGFISNNGTTSNQIEEIIV